MAAADDALAALLSEMSVQPGALDRAYMRRLIAELMGENPWSFDVWDRSDLIYVPGVHHEQAGLLNWASPGDYTLTPVNAPSFTAYEGFAGDGSTSYLETGWVPATHAGKMGDNDAHISAWSMTERAGDGGRLMGVTGTSGSGLGSLSIQSRSGTNNFGILIFDPVALNAGGQSSSFGLFAADRADASNAKSYHNGGARSSSSSSSSSGRPNQSLPLLVFRGSSFFAAYSSDTLGAATAGASLGDDGHAALHYALDRYFTRTPEIGLGRRLPTQWLGRPPGGA